MHVIHRVATRSGGIRGFDDHIAAEVCHFGTVGTVGVVIEGKRYIERKVRTVDCADAALFSLGVVARAFAEGLPGFVLPHGSGQYDSVSRLPTADRLRQNNLCRSSAAGLA